MEPITHTLAYPIKRTLRAVGAEPTEETITEVTISRRPVGADMRSVGNATGMPMLLILIGRLTGLPPSSIDMMDIQDVTALSEIVSDFLPDSQGTGPT